MWLIGCILWLLPISIFVDFGTKNIEFRNKTEKRLAETLIWTIFPIPFLYYFIEYLIKINFEISLLMFLFNILWYGAGVLMGIGIMIWLYEKIFKYAIRPLRSVLHEFIYVFIDFVFMRNYDVITIDKEQIKEKKWISKKLLEELAKISKN